MWEALITELTAAPTAHSLRVSSELRCPLRAIVSVAARLLCGCRLLILPEPIARMHLKPERTTCSAVQQHASALQLQPLQQR